MVFSKGATPGDDLSCIIWKNGIFFPKTRYFFLGLEVRDDLSQERHGNMILSVYTYGCYKRSVTPLCQKKYQRWSYPAKMHLKVIDVLDWHPRKSYIGLKFGLFFNLLGWRHSTMNNVQYLLYYSAPTSCVWRCAWAPIKEIICPLGDGL